MEINQVPSVTICRVFAAESSAGNVRWTGTQSERREGDRGSCDAFSERFGQSIRMADGTSSFPLVDTPPRRSLIGAATGRATLGVSPTAVVGWLRCYRQSTIG